MISKPKKWLAVSTITLIVSVLIIAIIRPDFGIDFTGGSLLEISSQGSLEQVRERTSTVIANSVQSTDANSLIIRTETLNEAKHQEVISALQENNLLEEELRFESIGPTIGQQLKKNSVAAIIIAVGAMIFYLAYTFRQAAGLISSWKFGIAAAVALVHDVLFVTAAFSLLKYLGATIDTLFVTAMLAILGYSVNDTIVLFNRFKEEWLKTRTGRLIDIMDLAAKKTLARSLNTSFTTLLVLIALLLLGGETLRWFVTALAIGTIIGTYSSIFVAPPVLYFLSKK